MAFKDLHEAVAELFNQDDLLEDAFIDARRFQRIKAVQAQRLYLAEVRLNDRLRRKRNRAAADALLPPPQPTPFACAHCEAAFASKPNFLVHLRLAHGIVFDARIQCRLCREPYPSDTALVDHWRSAHRSLNVLASSAQRRAGALARHHLHSRPPEYALLPVRVSARANSPVAYYRRIIKPSRP